MTDRVSRPHRRTGRPRGSPNNREAILQAARDVFAEHGFDASIRSIASRAAIDPALIYHYYGSKLELLIGVLQAEAGDSVSIDRQAAELATGDPARLGERFVAALMASYEAPFMRAAMRSLPELLATTADDPGTRASLSEGLLGGGIGRLLEVLQAPDRRLRAALIGAEIAGLVIARFVLGVEPLASADPAAVARWYGPAVQRLLTEPLA